MKAQISRNDFGVPELRSGWAKAHLRRSVHGVVR